MTFDAGETLGQRLERYLARHWGDDVRVRDLSRIPGGASRETYRFDAEIGGKTRGLILRRDPVGSLIDTDRQTEFLAYRSFHGIVPVPEPLVLETEGGCAGAAVLHHEPDRRRPGAVGDEPRTLWRTRGRDRRSELFAILGRIARCDPATLPISRLLRGARPCRLLARGAGWLAGR